jgi:ABC-type lipoprotein release transport system permease subunit
VLVRLADAALAQVLFEVRANDPAALVGAALLLLASAALACLPPALRAMRVDPVEGLRE